MRHPRYNDKNRSLSDDQLMRTKVLVTGSAGHLGEALMLTSANAQANELLYRRADIEDIVAAHVSAEARLSDPGFRQEKGFRRYIISARTPFQPGDCGPLRANAAEVVRRLFPGSEALYEKRQWELLPSMDRVYDSSLAINELGWQPRYDFQHVLDCLKQGTDFRSPLAREVGSKGYHSEAFAGGPYPVQRG